MSLGPGDFSRPSAGSTHLGLSTRWGASGQCPRPALPPSAGRVPTSQVAARAEPPSPQLPRSLTHSVFLSSQVSPAARILAAPSFGAFSCRKRHSCSEQTLFLLFPVMFKEHSKKKKKKDLPLKIKKSKIRIGPKFPPGRRHQPLAGT